MVHVSTGIVMGCGTPRSAVLVLAMGPSHGRFVSYDEIEGMKVSGNRFRGVFDIRKASPFWRNSLVVDGRRGLTGRIA